MGKSSKELLEKAVSEVAGDYFVKVYLPCEEGREYEEGQPVCVSTRGNKVIIDLACSHQVVYKEST